MAMKMALIWILAVSWTQAAVLFRADLRPEFVVPKNGGPSPAGVSSAWGTAFFELDLTPGAPFLTYDIVFNNISVLNDITGIHLHFGHAPDAVTVTSSSFGGISIVPLHDSADGPNGPHLLNIYGLPREDDTDLVVDGLNNRISGLWDNFDANFGVDGMRDPGDSVGVGSAIDELLIEEVYLQVHTNTFPAPDTGELRGQLLIIPEPGALTLLGIAGIVVMRRRKR